MRKGVIGAALMGIVMGLASNGWGEEVKGSAPNGAGGEDTSWIFGGPYPHRSFPMEPEMELEKRRVLEILYKFYDTLPKGSDEEKNFLSELIGKEIIVFDQEKIKSPDSGHFFIKGNHEIDNVYYHIYSYFSKHGKKFQFTLYVKKPERQCIEPHDVVNAFSKRKEDFLSSGPYIHAHTFINRNEFRISYRNNFLLKEKKKPVRITFSFRNNQKNLEGGDTGVCTHKIVYYID